MNPVEKLHYALGEIAYAMVWSDTAIRYDEISKFMDAVTAGLDVDTREFDLLGTMFSAITGDKRDAATTYRQAMEEIKRNADYLHPRMKKNFVKTLEHVESTYAPFTVIENDGNLLDRFKNDVASLNGHRVYMGAIYLN